MIAADCNVPIPLHETRALLGVAEIWAGPWLFCAGAGKGNAANAIKAVSR